MVTDTTANELQQVLPKAESVSVGQAGHMVAGDQNDAFTGVVIEFLARVMPAERR